MFGYVRPVREELKVREWEAYRAVYCGLCHTIGRRYGFFPRLFLNYDFTFLAMLLAEPKRTPCFSGKRCIACPHRKKPVVEKEEGLEVAADESIILTYYQLLDKQRDGRFPRGIFAGLLSFLLRPAYRKAAELRPGFDRAVVENLERLHRLEEEGCPTLDGPADTFAAILRAAAPPCGDLGKDRAMGQLLYHVGRWIYLLDAWDDRKKDEKTGDYNPLPLRFPDGPEKHEDEVRGTLDRSAELAISAFNLMEFGCWTPVLGNILCIGLPAVERAVFSGMWKKGKKETGEM